MRMIAFYKIQTDTSDWYTDALPTLLSPYFLSRNKNKKHIGNTNIPNISQILYTQKV